MSLFCLTEPSLELAVASALLVCQLPKTKDDDSDALLTFSTFLPLPTNDCVLEVPPSLLSFVPLKPIMLPYTWESPTIDLGDVEDISSLAVAPAEFAVPACAFWSPTFDFECDQFHDVSTCAPSSPSSDDPRETLLTDRKLVWWRWSGSGDVCARSTGSSASTAVPRTNSNSSIGSNSSSASPRISSRGTSRSKRFLHKAKDLFCEMVCSDEKCSNSAEMYCTNDVTARTVVPQLQPLNGRMPRFPSCEIGPPRLASPDFSKKRKSQKAGLAIGSGVPRVLGQTESVISACNANVLAGVGACANSVLAVSPVCSSKNEFCKLLREVLIGEAPSIQQSALVRFP